MRLDNNKPACFLSKYNFYDEEHVQTLTRRIKLEIFLLIMIMLFEGIIVIIIFLYGHFWSGGIWEIKFF